MLRLPTDLPPTGVEPDADDGRHAAGTASTFAALRYRNYRLLWFGSLISQTGDWIDQIALNWLVLTTTGSAADLGLVNLFRGMPIFLFTLFGGVAADRFERRSLMIVTQSAAMILAFVLAGLVYFGAASIWLLVVVATCRGIIVAFNLPARHTLISELVPREHLANAVALTSLTLNLTKVMGPLIAGLLIAGVGVEACFVINGVSFVAVLWTLWAMRLPPSPRERPQHGVRHSLSEGFRYIAGNGVLRLLVTIALVPMFFGQPYQTMLTVFASQVYDIGPEGLGLLAASAACGSVLGAILVARLSHAGGRGIVMLGYLLAYGLALVAFSLNSWVLLAPVLLLFVGAMQVAYNASNNAIMQLSVPDHLRGRVLSTLFLNRGLVPLGTAFVAFLSTAIGAQLAMAATTSVIVLSALLLLGFSPAMRGLKVGGPPAVSPP